MLATDSVAINRLHVKGDKRSSQTLVRELEQTSWAKPLPAHLQHAWILVREIQVRAKARDLSQLTAKQLDLELHSAVRAIHGGAATANAIWFASLPELIAFLLADLALGKTMHWYWARWTHLLKYPKQEAVARLLCEHCEHLPSIIMQLQSRQQLLVVWSQINDGSAKTIVHELLKAWSLPSLDVWNAEVNVQLPETHMIRPVLQAQAVLLSHWRPLLKGLSLQDGRVLLAAILHGLIYTPIWLQQQPAALVQAFASVACPMVPEVLQPPSAKQSVAHTGSEKVNTKIKSASLVGPFSNHTPVLSTSSVKRKTGISAATDSGNFDEEETPSQESIAQVNHLLTHKSRENKEGRSVSEIDDNKRQYSSDVINPEEESSQLENLSGDTNLIEGYEFTTQAGGVFYLLNPLQRLLTSERLAAQKEASVWRWLLDLYHAFAQQFTALEGLIDPPLLRFILQQLQPGATSAELQQLSLDIAASPPCDFAIELFGEFQTQFESADFWQELKVDAGFFATPARVIATASHWDIYFPLQAVRLDLRLAAWDVNPGWLPWLGRVVKLHYVEQSGINGVGDAS